MPAIRFMLGGLLLLLLVPQVTGAGRVQFNRDVRPILADHCFACHGPDRHRRRADLRLDDREAALAQKAFLPGQPDASALVGRVFSSDPEEQMPPAEAHKPLTGAQKETLKRWIAEGAEYQIHWAYLPPVAVEPPRVAGEDPSRRHPVDAFIQDRLTREGLKPAPEASRETLIRRVTLDLTGLPPTPAEVQAFREDRANGAFERVVDRLLASPHYGERMAVDWLDAARYADSNGYQVDRDRELWPWRDWVIRAFNEDLPFDRFTIEQLAGDLLPGATFEQRIATGFHRNHMLNEEGGIIPEEFLAEATADRVETTAAVWMGQTFNCARCHDHKFDPFTQRDFYGLKAFFHNVPERGIGVYENPIRKNAPPFVRLPAPVLEAQLAQLEARLKSANELLAALGERSAVDLESWVGKLADGTLSATSLDPRASTNLLALAKIASSTRSAADQKQLAEFRLSQFPEHRCLTDEIASLKESIAAAEGEIPTSLVMEEMNEPRATFVLMRGAYDKPGDRVTAATPAALPAMDDEQPRNRLGLARWLVSPRHPLTARVVVNRFWQQLFGTGLVRTSEDFGSQGEPPSHPELLDWLAVSFRDGGWDVKRFLRLLVTSDTYRQRSQLTPELRERDPDNRLLARGPRFRLPAEMIRDQALAASGLLVPKLGGPSVKPYHPPGLYEQVTAGSGYNVYIPGQGEDLHRRSLYTYWKRSVPHPAMLLFDAPFRETCVLRRPRTNTALQALNLLNDPTYVEAARALAQRIMREGGETVEARLIHGVRLVLARNPTPAELRVLGSAWETAQHDFAGDLEAARLFLAVGETPADPALDVAQLAAYTTFASALLNLDETLTKE